MDSVILRQINQQCMENKNKTIRLIYPQWQGGDIARWITDQIPECYKTSVQESEGNIAIYEVTDL